ncbi:hypothetical protein [Alkalitalea saponilacus]|uniref:Uncharacterized protein n=1 Tax=Alkalitalea saponilacus TaxID=889453 RepID=A0A1T5BSU4_9BACT|nr:hypothetical protein [Alkalitalea saponilacus]ASB49610.1 hypothetical protein CDL62_10875 [Alkalitalea saponilacus]SKB50244.1 hypothetical protein SAMN03080601_00611 [Alkalitalea saponilacus]
MKNGGYLPIDPDFFKILADALEKDHIRIHFFNESNEVDFVEGSPNRLWTPDDFSWFFELLGSKSLRIDRIITLNGRPGPAYDEYDRFALECLTCMGGMD